MPAPKVTFVGRKKENAGASTAEAQRGKSVDASAVLAPLLAKRAAERLKDAVSQAVPKRESSAPKVTFVGTPKETAQRSGGQQGGERDDGAVRAQYAQRHPEETGGEWGAIVRGLNSARVQGDGAALNDYVNQYKAYTAPEAIQSRIDAMTAQVNKLETERKAISPKPGVQVPAGAYAEREIATATGGLPYAAASGAVSVPNGERLRSIDKEIETLQQKIARETATKTYMSYEALREAPDFEEKSVYRRNRGETVGWDPILVAVDGRGKPVTGFVDPVYDSVNGDSEAIRRGKRYAGLVYEDVPEDVAKLFNYIYETQGKEAAHRYIEFMMDPYYSVVQSGLRGAVDGSGITSLGKTVIAGVGLIPGMKQEAKDSIERLDLGQQQAARQHPVAYGVGNVGGAVGTSVAIGTALGGAPAIAGLGQAGKAAATGAGTMGTMAALQGAGDVATGRRSFLDLAEDVVISSAAGGAGGAASSWVSGMGSAAMKSAAMKSAAMKSGAMKSGAMKSGAVKAALGKGVKDNVVANVLNQGAAGAAFSVASMGTRKLLDPDYAPTKEEVIQELATTFLFSTISSAIHMHAQTKAAKAQLDYDLAATKSNYANIVLQEKAGQMPTEAALDALEQETAQLRSRLNNTQYVGHGKEVQEALGVLDLIDENIVATRQRIGGGSTAARSGGLSVPGGLAVPPAVPVASPGGSMPNTAALAAAAENVETDLQDVGAGGTMETITHSDELVSPDQQERNIDTWGGAAEYGGETRQESRQAFRQRSAGEGLTVIEGETADYGYKRAEGVGQRAGEIQKELKKLGIEADITDGTVWRNRDGVSAQRTILEAATVGGKTVLISSSASLPARYAAGHEAFHRWKNMPERQYYIETLEDNLDFTSEAFLNYQSAIAKAYLGEEVDLADPGQLQSLREELFAYLSGDIHEGGNDAALRPMFRDFDAVKRAWERLIYMKEVTSNGSGQLHSEEQHGGVQQVQKVPGEVRLREVPGVDPQAEAGGDVPGLRAEGAGGPGTQGVGALPAGSDVDGRTTADGGVDTPTGDLALNREKSGIAEGEVSPVVMPLIDAQKTASQGETGSTAINTDPATHTPEQQAVINEYQADTDEALKEVFQGYLEEPKRGFSRHNISSVSERQAQDVQRLLGGDYTGYRNAINSNGILHILGDHGPDGAVDHSMADLNDIARMGYVLDHYDDVEVVTYQSGEADYSSEFRDKNNRPVPMLRFSKRVDGTYYVIEAVPEAQHKKLWVVSAYMEKADGGTQAPDAIGPRTTPNASLASSPSASMDSIPQTPPGVNPEGGDGAPNSVGAAARGFEAPGTGGTRESRLAQTSMGWNRVRGEASLYDRAQWDESMRYEPQSEQQSLQYARDMVYREVGGEQVCVFDLDPASFEDLYQTYSAAPAWDGVMTDVGHMVEMELLRRTVAGAESNENYNRWVQLCKEKAGKTGQGVQAHDKWSRRLGECAASGEKEAWEALRQMDMPEEERQRRFSTIVSFDTRIEAAKDAAQLQEIILDIARERGTLNRALSGKESARMTRLVEKALSGLDEAELKRFAYASSAALVKDLTPADAGEMMKTIQVLNMLSNPKTAMRNLVGNTTFYALDAMTMRVGAILDMALANATGTRSIAMEPSALSQESRAAILKALKRSVAEITLDVDMEGGNRYQRSGRRTFRASGGIAERVLSALERNMGYLMTTTDEGYKGAARATQAATQRLVDQGKIKTSNPDYAKDQADTLAKYRTFQEDGIIAAIIQGIHDTLNIVGVGDSGKRVFQGKLGPEKNGLKVHAFGLGDLAAPFTRVAGNLVQVGIDYSPAKAVNGIKEIVEAVAAAHNGKTVDPAKQAKGVSDFTRGMTGTMLATGFMLLAAKGAIRRAEDEGDEDVAARNKAAGMVGTQVNLSVLRRVVSGGSWAWQDGDILVDLSSIEPLNYIVDMGAELAKLQNEGNIVTRYAKATMNSATHAAEDLPVMETVSGLAKDIMVYHKDAGPAALERLGKTVISSVTPNVFAAAAKALDDKQRSTYSSAERGLQRSVDILLDTAKSRTPVLRETLPTAVGPDGAEKENPGSLAERLINAMVNPFGVNTYTQSEEGREMDRVRSETGETDFYPASTIPSSVSYTKDGVTHAKDLDYAQRQAFQKTRSTAHLVAISGMMGTKEYQKADVETQAALLKLCYDYAYGQAKAEVLGEEAAPAWVSHAQAAQKELGISTAEYLYYYETLGGDIMSGSGYDKTCRMVKAGVKLEDWAKMRKATDADRQALPRGTEVEGV